MKVLVGGRELTAVGSPSQSSCGCVWQRTAEFGDVIVVRCARNYPQSKISCDGSLRKRRVV